MHPLYLPARVRFVLRRAHRGHEDGHQDEVTHDHDLRPQAPLAAPRAVVELHAALDAAAVRVVDLVVLPTSPIVLLNWGSSCARGQRRGTGEIFMCCGTPAAAYLDHQGAVAAFARASVGPICDTRTQIRRGEVVSPLRSRPSTTHEYPVGGRRPRKS